MTLRKASWEENSLPEHWADRLRGCGAWFDGFEVLADAILKATGSDNLGATSVTELKGAIQVALDGL